MNFKKIDLSKSELQQSEMNKVLGGYKANTRDPGACEYHDCVEVTVDPCSGEKTYGDIDESGPCN